MSIESEAPKEVLIATLDILGMSKLMLDANQKNLQDITQEIYHAVDNAKNGLQKLLANVLPLAPTSQDAKGGILDALFRRAVFSYDFSDTLVIGCDVSRIDFDALQSIFPSTESIKESKTQYEDAAVKLFCWQVTCSFCAFLNTGFPVRGCVEVGPVCFASNAIVGRPYVNALKISDSLDFSGVVVTEEALKYCKDHENTALKGNFFDTVELLVPVKGMQGYQPKSCVNWTHPTPSFLLDGQFDENHDWRQLLYEKFAANGKSMTESALRKLANTENTIRAFIMQNKTLKTKEKTINGN